MQVSNQVNLYFDYCKKQQNTMGRYQKSTGGQTGFNIQNSFNGFLALNTHKREYSGCHT
jgi:hypothetical protein